MRSHENFNFLYLQFCKNCGHWTKQGAEFGGELQQTNDLVATGFLLEYIFVFKQIYVIFVMFCYEKLQVK